MVYLYTLRLYSLAVETGFVYGDFDNVVGFITNLSNLYRGKYLDKRQLHFVDDPTNATQM